MARRHASPGRSDRRSRPASRLRTSADDVPRRRTGAAAVRSAHRARSARAHGAARHGLLRSDHLRVHRSEGGRAVPRMGSEPVAHRQSAVGVIRGDAAEPAAGPHRRAQPQSPARPRRRAPLRDRHALLARRRNARRRIRVDRPRHARSLERRAARRSTSSTSRASSNSSRRRIRCTPAFAETERPILVAGPRRRDRRQRQDDRRVRTTRAGDRRGARSACRG